MLSYLRNGGTLPPLPLEDEQLLERIRVEFDYFCFQANPADMRSWVEKFRDGAYTIAHVVPTLPNQASFSPFASLMCYGPTVQFTDLCDFAAVHCTVEVKSPDGDYAEYDTLYGVWLDGSSGEGAYVLAPHVVSDSVEEMIWAVLSMATSWHSLMASTVSILSISAKIILRTRSRL